MTVKFPATSAARSRKNDATIAALRSDMRASKPDENNAAARAPLPKYKLAEVLVSSEQDGTLGLRPVEHCGVGGPGSLSAT
jgi:hypothetical protein